MKKLVLYLIFYSNVLVSSESDTMSLWEAGFYDENAKLQQKIAENFLHLIQEKFKEFPFDGHLLDIGCGTGRFTNHLQSKYSGKIIGIDSSKEMIAFAKEHFVNKNIEFHQDEAEKLKTVDTNSIDGIVSFSCLHWVHDQEAAFSAMHRVLKPGGWIALMFCAETGIDDPMDWANEQAIQEEPWKDYFKNTKKEVQWYIAKPPVLKSQLERTGFQVHFMGTQNFDFPFEDRSALANWILCCFLELKLLPTHLQLSCAQRIADLYLQATSHFQPQGPHCVYRSDAFMLIAQK